MKIGFVFLAMMLVGCAPDNEPAIKAMDDSGFTNAVVVENGVFMSQMEGCSESDGAWYHVTATNPAGKRVNMLVCCGGTFRYKGCTVRSK